MHKSLSLLLSAAALIAVTAGCKTGPGRAVRDFLYEPKLARVEAPPAWVTNIVLETNIVTVLQTNDSGVVTAATNTIVQPVEHVEFLPPRLVLITNGWEKREAVFETAQTVAGMVPGWGGVAAAAIGGLGTAGAAILSRRKMKDAAVGTIQGIDEFRRGLQGTEQGRALDAELTRLLQRAHVDWGALDTVKRLLDDHTGYTQDQGKVAELLTAAAK